jgi:hypothetical protein
MVLFAPTPIQGDYTAPITLFVAGAAFLMHAAWCSYMGETEDSYPTDSRVLPDVGRRWSSDESEDIGFDNKFLICVIAGGFLIVCAAIAFLGRHHAGSAVTSM